jgi:hypothetical protein
VPARAAEPGVTPALNLGQLLLGRESRCVILRMIAGIFAERQRRIRFERRVEADEQRLILVEALKPVHPVGYRDIVFG